MSSPTNGHSSRAILRAARAGALAEARTRETIKAAAEGIAERTGVALLDVQADPDGVSVHVEGPTMIAMGLLAELRRTTQQWHRTHHHEPLWSEAPEAWDDFDA